MGVWLYPLYRQRVKRPIFETAPAVGWLFERKEHLAFGALLLAWAGALAYVASVRAPRDSGAGRVWDTNARSRLRTSSVYSIFMIPFRSPRSASPGQ